MGTVKYSGSIASFHCPTNAEIRSLKVHFSPKQEGIGDPSPENVREIVGWDGVVVHNDDGNVVPKEYQKVEYLESTGTQYLNTGINGASGLNIECILMLNSNAAISNCGMIGSREGTGDTRFYAISFYQSKWHVGMPTDIQSRDVVKQIKYKARLETSASKYSLYVNDELYQANTSHQDTNYPLYVFACNNYGNAARFCSGRLYSLLITNGITQLLNFVPCRRKSDDKPGMYDTVTQTFFTNQGTGEFICGPDVGETVAVNWSEDVGIVYGGYVDLIAGELVQTQALITIDGSQTVQVRDAYTKANAFRIPKSQLPYLLTSYVGDEKSNYMTPAAYVDNEPWKFWINMTNNALFFLFPKTYTAANSVQTYFSENPLQVAVHIAPITYQLTPIQLQTFLGQNNVWSNADYVEVEYDLHETQTLLQRKAFIMANQPHIASASGAIASFNTDLRAPLKECKVYFSPVQEGSGDPSPTNVRPISGWTGCEVYRGYEYLSNVQITIGKTLNASGLETTEGGMAVTDYIPVEVGHTYTLKFTSTTAGRTRRIFGYSASKEPTSQLASVSWATVGNTFSMNAEIPSDTSYIRACYYNNDIDKTLIEPSTVTTFPIDWTTEAGTIYGGYVDLVNGEIVQTYYKIIADGVNVKANSKYWSPKRGLYGGGIVYIDPIGKFADNSLSNIFCDILEVTRLAITDHQHLYVPLAGKLYTVFYLFNISDTETELTKQEVIDQTNAWLQEHPTTIIYELTEPIHYSLTPTQLKSLVGTNNLWSSADEVTISYWTH